MNSKPAPMRPTERQIRARRSRNVALALALAAFAILLYVVTWAKLGANILERQL